MSNFPYKKSISPIQLLGTQSVNREATYGTHFSTDGIGGYMEVFNVTDLIFTIPTGQTGSIEYTGNTIPVNLLKGGAGPFSTDVLTLNPDNISSGRRKLGMLVYVYEYDQVYQFAIDNYETLWNNATGATNTVVISEYGTTVNTSTPEGQLLVSSWTANTIDGVSGVTRSNAVWKKYYGTNLAVTGGSFNGVTGTLTLTNITGGTQNITGFGSGGGGGAPITGGTFDSSNLELDLTSSAGTITVTGVTGLYISAGTYSSGNTTLSLSNSTGGTITITGFSQTFSGGSGNCINQLYLNEIYPCTSDIKIQPLSTGRVYFGNNSGASGLTIDFNSETAQKSARLGLNINNPEYTFDFKSFDRKSGFFFRDDIVAPFGDWKQIAISGDTDNVLMYTSFQPDASGSLGSHGIAIGSRGYGNSSTTTNNSLGRTGDTFVFAFSNTNGLNIINGPGTNTDDYIRFYAGQTVGSNTPDVHIQGSGSTRGFVGIGTTAVTNPLHVYATSNPLRLEGLQSSANTRFLVANSDGVVTYTTTAPSGGGGFSAVSINNVVQFDTSASQTINFSGVNINITSASTNTLVFSGGGVTVPGSNNQVLTSNGSGGIVAESLLTFDGLASSPPLNVNGITIWRGKNNTSKSIGIGPQTLYNTSTGTANIAIGPGSQTNTNTGYNNISIGLSSLSANTSGNRNIAIGTSAMNLNSGGYGNVAIGDRSLYKHYIGDFNIAIGASSLYYSDTKSSGTDFNIAIGRCAMFYNSGGTENIAIGRRALAGNNPNKQFGNFNIALGRGSLYQNYNGDYNIAIGRSSLYSNSTGLHNVAIGRNSNGENTTGNNNISIGYNSLYYNTTGLGNVSIGADSLYSNVYGNHNVSIGYLSGKNSAGSRNVFIGRESGFNEVNSDRLHIANCQTRIPLIFGEFDTNRLGINTTTVTNTLHVSATTHPVRFEGLQSSANTRYLVANSDGVVTYVTGTTGSFSGDYLPLSGGTVTGGTSFTAGLTANTISATTYLNLPIDPDTYVTGFTLNSNTVTLSQNRNDQYSAFTINLSAYTGNTGISGDYLPLSGGTVTGLTNFNSGLTSNSITATTISASTYLNVPNYNAGLLINSDQWVNNNDGTVTLPTTYVALYSQTGYPSTVEVYLITSGTSGTEFPALSNNDTNYIVVDYNSGSPTWNILTDNSTINGVTIVLTHIIYRANNFLHVLDFGDEGFALPNKLNDRVIAIDRFGRESGFSLGLSASTGVVTLTSGVAWNGTNRQSLVAVNSQDDIFFQVYHTGGTWTYTTSANTLNNLYYDNGTNPVLATSGKYLVNWYFRGQEINDHLYEVWGNDEYDNVSEAQLSTEPNLPELITSHAFLTGRIIVQVSATTGTVESAFAQVFQPTTVQSHNDLTGIQGGTSGEYYHLTSSQYSNLSSFKNIQINNVTQFSSTTLTDSLNFSGVNINITSGVGNTLIFSAGTGGSGGGGGGTSISGLSYYTATTIGDGVIDTIDTTIGYRQVSYDYTLTSNNGSIRSGTFTANWNTGLTIINYYDAGPSEIMESTDVIDNLSAIINGTDIDITLSVTPNTETWVFKSLKKLMPV